MISERTLRNWRRDALLVERHLRSHNKVVLSPEKVHIKREGLKLCKYVLSLTQELMDQYLIDK